MRTGLAWIVIFSLAAASPAPAQTPVTSQVKTEADRSRTLVHEAEVAAPIAQAWAAISTEEGWEGWAVPVAWMHADRPGILETSYDAKGEPGGATNIEQQILAAIPGRLLAFRTIKAPQGFPHFDTYAKVTSIFELEPLDDRRTLVRLTATGYAPTPAGEQLLGFFTQGNAVTLQGLQKRFSEGPRDWSRPQE